MSGAPPIKRIPGISDDWTQFWTLSRTLVGRPKSDTLLHSDNTDAHFRPEVTDSSSAHRAPQSRIVGAGTPLR